MIPAVELLAEALIERYRVAGMFGMAARVAIKLATDPATAQKQARQAEFAAYANTRAAVRAALAAQRSEGKS